MAGRLLSRGLLVRCRRLLGNRLAVSGLVRVGVREDQMHTSYVHRDDFMEQVKVDREHQEKERMNMDKEEEIKAELLDAALVEVLTHGWNKSAITAAATKLGHPSVVAGLVGGVEEVVLHHISKSNRQLDAWMVDEVARLTAGGSRLPIGKFIRSCVVQRLSHNIPYLSAGLWAQGVAMVAQPAWAGRGVELGQEVCDDIWHRAGDTSADLNWYTKRVTLGMVMAATEVFMVQDTSEGFRDTWDFLDRRLEDLSIMPTISKVPGDIAGVVEGLLQTAKILVGVQK